MPLRRMPFRPDPPRQWGRSRAEEVTQICYFLYSKLVFIYVGLFPIFFGTFQYAPLNALWARWRAHRPNRRWSSSVAAAWFMQ